VVDTRETPDALLGDPAQRVEVDLLVRTRLDAGAIAVAARFVDEDDPVILALEDCVVRTSFDTGRSGAVRTETRQVEEVGVGILAAALVLVPVHSPTGIFADRVHRGGS